MFHLYLTNFLYRPIFGWVLGCCSKTEPLRCYGLGTTVKGFKLGGRPKPHRACSRFTSRLFPMRGGMTIISHWLCKIAIICSSWYWSWGCSLYFIGSTVSRTIIRDRKFPLDGGRRQWPQTRFCMHYRLLAHTLFASCPCKYFSWMHSELVMPSHKTLPWTK